MKFYMRDPANAIEGMQGLTLEQIGAYNLLLDHLYCRDGVLKNDDELIRCMLNIDPRRWRRLKAELMAAGKIRITIDGLLTANGVSSTLLRANVRSKSAQSAANVRWENYRIAKQINETAVLSRNATKNYNNTKYSSTNSNAGAELSLNEPSPAEPPTAGVARNSSSGGVTTTTALEMSLRKKGWI